MLVPASLIGRRGRVVLLAGLALLGLASLAQAQRFQFNGAPFTPPAQRGIYTSISNPQFAGMYQWAHAQGIIGRGIGNFYRNIPPYALGYNPYPSPIISTGPLMPWGGGYSSALSSYGNPYTGGAALSTNPVSSAYDASLSPGYSNPYTGWGSIYTPEQGYLYGAADVTNANAQYQLTLQRARLVQNEVTNKQLDLRRRLIEEAQWERKQMPDAATMIAKENQSNLDRARTQATLTDIWSARALNDLLAHLIDQQGKGNRGPSVPLDDDLLKHINVTAGTGGNVGLLRNGGKLQWPASLQGPAFAEVRERLDKRLPDAVQQLGFNNPVDRGTLTDIRAEVEKANAILDQRLADMTPTEFLEAKRFLNQLSDAVRAIQDPNASKYFTQQWVAKGKNVAELVDWMRNNGLKFAPAVPGDEAAYRALHHAMVAYDASMAGIASAPRPGMP
jgi:hypothetical protein